MKYLGIDISKDSFDVALLTSESKLDKFKTKTFKNNPTGFEKLTRWLSHLSLEPVHVAMEATNIYWQDLAEYLADQGVLVSVVNPSLVKKEAGSWGLRNKTDKVDATTIARYCWSKKPDAWIASRPEVRELRDMLRHMDALEEDKLRHLNRLETASSDAIRASLVELIEFLDTKIEELQKQIDDHIDKHPGIKGDVGLLKSIPGVGQKTAAVIVAELPDVANFTSSKPAVAYTGLSPMKAESGKFKGKTRLCKFGNARLRKAIYFPAVVAARYNPVIREFYQRLRGNGKCKMSAIGACMRKLLAIAYGVLKTGTPFRAPA